MGHQQMAPEGIFCGPLYVATALSKSGGISHGQIFPAAFVPAQHLPSTAGEIRPPFFPLNHSSSRSSFSYLKRRPLFCEFQSLLL